MNHAVFRETEENLRKYRDIKLVTTAKRRNKFLFRTRFSYYKVFHRKPISKRNKKSWNTYEKNSLKKLGLLILEWSKILMYQFWYYYVKPKCGGKAKMRYRDTENFIGYTETNYSCKDIAEDIKSRFDTSNYELDRLLPKGKNY